MRDILEPGPSDPDPMKRAQSAMARQPLPKRFYREASVGEGEGGFGLLLDGRPARTPGRRPLAAPTRAAAALVATEWAAQGETVDPARMPATRMVNTALDGFEGRIAEVQADVANYAASDLVFYRAGEPEGLVAEQAMRWDPVVRWAEERFGVRFVLAEGVMHQAQGDAALAAVRAAVSERREPIELAALHVMTTISGSCLIALMAAEGALPAAEAWAASIVDEEWNARLWGHDEEAERRLERRREEFMAAYALHLALRAA